MGRDDTPFTTRCVEGQTLTIPVKHGEGNWYADDDLYAELEERGQIVAAVVEGNSMRAASRMTGVARNTINKLLVDLGQEFNAEIGKPYTDLRGDIFGVFR